MNKVLKRITVLLLVMTLMIIGGGCNMNLYSEETLQKKAIRYMEKKYGNDVKFSVKMAYVEGNTYNVYMNVEEHEGWEPVACWSFTTKKFTDNYMSWFFREQVEEAFYPVFQEIYGDCKIFNAPYGFQRSDIYNYDTKLEDYLTTVKASDFCLFTCEDPNQREEDIKKLNDIILTEGWNADVTIIYVSEEDIMGINRSNYEEILDGNYLWRTTAVIRNGEELFTGGRREGISK